MTPNKKKLAVSLVFVAVIVAAANLRAGISSLGAVLEPAMASFNAPSAIAGVVTAMPGFAFAAMGLAAVPIARKLGLSVTLLAGMVAIAIGLTVRPLIGAALGGGIASFMIATGAVVCGIALLNVLLPAWIKEHGGRHIVVLMSCYSGFLGLSGAVAPLSALWFSGNEAWRPALGIWAILAAVQVVVWIYVAARLRGDAPSGPPMKEVAARSSVPDAATVPMRRSPTAVALMVLFGLQSSNAYVQMGWLPQMLIDQGVSPARAAMALSVVGSLNVVGGIIMPFVISRIHELRPLLIGFGVLTMTGYLGIIIAGSAAPLLWAGVLGLAGMCFPTCLALLTARTRAPIVTARLSGFVQPYGYLVAGTLPLLIGVIYQATGQWTMILCGMAATGLGMCLAGLRAGRNIYIDDELVAEHASEHA